MVVKYRFLTENIEYLFERLKEEKGITQTQIAAETGLSRQNFYTWRTQKAKPNFKNLITFASYVNQHLGIQIDERVLLFTDIQNPGTISDFETRYMMLSDNQRRIVDDLIDEFLT